MKQKAVYGTSDWAMLKKNAIKQLPQLVIGALLKGPTTVKCESCGVSKVHKIVFRKQLT